MAVKTINESILTAIADAIRAKLGVQTTYKPSEMAAAIAEIGTAQLESKTIIANGIYELSKGYDGFSDVTVNVPPELTPADEGKVVQNGLLVQQTSVTKTANGTYDTTTNNQVVVNVSGGGGGGLLTPIATDYNNGYITEGYYVYDPGGFDNQQVDVYEVQEGHYYMFGLGATVGSNPVAAFCGYNPTEATSDISATIIAHFLVSDPYPQFVSDFAYHAVNDGYLAIAKDDGGTTGLKSYVLDVTEATT